MSVGLALQLAPPVPALLFALSGLRRREKWYAVAPALAVTLVETAWMVVLILGNFVW